jgi:hypothetical protein
LRRVVLSEAFDIAEKLNDAKMQLKIEKQA